MTNYQKRRSSVVEKIYNESLDKMWPCAVGAYEMGVISIGYDQGFADALADCRPMVELVTQIEKEYFQNGGLFNPELMSVGGQRLESLIGKLVESVAHFKTLGEEKTK